MWPFTRRVDYKTVTKDDDAKAEIEAARWQAAQVRIESLAANVSEQERRIKRLEDGEAARSGALIEAADRLNAALRRQTQRERHERDRSERQRADRTNGAGHDSGDGERQADDDWLGGYLAIRGQHPGAATARAADRDAVLADDNDNEDED